MSDKITQLHASLIQGNFAALARAITIVENDLNGSHYLLQQATTSVPSHIVGITGAPGAGKSTLAESLVNHWVNEGRRIAVIAIDPSSPFNFGALLGDRIRMSQFYHHQQVYIRSLSSRGVLGGLHPRIWEIIEMVKLAAFDYILVETVGVGQSEVDIAGLADCTVVTLVPEGGDEIQTIKAGIMEIADVFALNKSDREGADAFYQKIRIMVHERAQDFETPVVKTIAAIGEGVPALAEAIQNSLQQLSTNYHRKAIMITEKIWQHVQRELMKNVSKKNLLSEVEQQMKDPQFNWYLLATQFLKRL